MRQPPESESTHNSRDVNLDEEPRQPDGRVDTSVVLRGTQRKRAIDRQRWPPTPAGRRLPLLLAQIMRSVPAVWRKLQHRVKEDQSVVQVLFQIRGIRILTAAGNPVRMTLVFVSAKQRYDTFLCSRCFKSSLDGRRSSRRPF